MHIKRDNCAREKYIISSKFQEASSSCLSKATQGLNGEILPEMVCDMIYGRVLSVIWSMTVVKTFVIVYLLLLGGLVILEICSWL
jgi:hypothetical protein